MSTWTSAGGVLVPKPVASDPKRGIDADFFWELHSSILKDGVFDHPFDKANIGAPADPKAAGEALIQQHLIVVANQETFINTGKTALDDQAIPVVKTPTELELADAAFRKAQSNCTISQSYVNSGTIGETDPTHLALTKAASDAYDAWIKAGGSGV